MRQFLRKLFLFSIGFLVFQSCKSFKTENLGTGENHSQIIDNLYFSSKNTDYIYKSQVDIYDNQLSGILIIKKINDDFHRVVLTSDFGNKLFDFEISQKDFKLNYIIPDMDKGMVKRFLEKDFRIMLREKFTSDKMFTNEQFIIYQSEEKKENYFLYFDKANELLTKIIYTEHGREKINFSFEAKKSIFADEIEIAHKDFKINIKLNQITENMQ